MVFLKKKNWTFFKYKHLKKLKKKHVFYLKKPQATSYLNTLLNLDL
jgi:hypothetical protein